VAYRLKLERAMEHLGVIRSEITTWLSSNVHRLPRQVDVVTGEFVYPVRVLGEIPQERWGKLIGDCLFDFRSCLDHLAYELAERHSGKPLSKSVAERSEFPIFGTRAPTASEWEARVGGIAPEAQEIIDSVQPYHRGAQYVRHELWALHELHNVDKHRALHLVLLNLRGRGLVRHGNAEILRQIYAIGQLRDGSELLRLSAVPIDPKQEIDLYFASLIDVGLVETEFPLGESISVQLMEIYNFINYYLLRPLSSYLPDDPASVTAR